MKLDPKPDTLLKLKDIYEAQYGSMPTVLRPTWYIVRPSNSGLVEKELKIKFLINCLKDQGFEGDYDILENKDLLICTHYCRLEFLHDEFGQFEFIPFCEGVDV